MAEQLNLAGIVCLCAVPDGAPLPGDGVNIVLAAEGLSIEQVTGLLAPLPGSFPPDSDFVI